MSRTTTIEEFVLDEFLPDLRIGDLDLASDLITSGVIDSLGLLKLIAWIEDCFEVVIGDDDLDPDNFRSVLAIDAFVAAATARQAGAAPVGS